MKSRRTALAVGLAAVATIVLVALVLAGCGSSGSSSSGTSASPSASGSGVTIDGATITPDSSINALLPSDIKTSGVLRVASALPYAPWEYYNPPDTKNFAGFDYDLSQAIGAKLGVTAQFVDTPFDSIILSVLGGKNDMIMADMYDNVDREKQLTFVDYAYDGTSILVLKGNPAGITNLDSLSGKVVTVLAGSTQQALLTDLNKSFKSAGKPPMTILSLQGSPEGLLAIKGGKAVAQLTDHSQAEYIANSTTAGKSFEVLSDPSAPHGYAPAIVGIGIDKSNTQLTTAVQKALQALIDDGSYKTIIDKYGLIGVDSAKTNQATAVAASASPSP
ncbi:MAG TPA: ABC transporter substrate-binding protein [Thermoleophilia bacterium]|nr:ABC transporter substrate-binding protein [Thermoleophilia bacterium]